MIMVKLSWQFHHDYHKVKTMKTQGVIADLLNLITI